MLCLDKGGADSGANKISGVYDMGQKLVIVESPAKAKTIGKYLGKNYVVKASMGHVKDLPKSQLGVDIDNEYNPKYITIRGKGTLLDKLKREAKKSDKVYLATDPDREGEAISWHLSHVLKLRESEKCRIEFHEITKNAIKNSIKYPRTININLVNAQQARRVLDRLVGYKISPILWRKIKWGLSAGRVQSVALKMICDREKSIIDFKPKEYWTIECELHKKSAVRCFNAKLTTFNRKKIQIATKEEADKITEDLKKGQFIVKSIKTTCKNKTPLPPFTTSTLQQDAYKRLNFSTKKTMAVAQQLYEGVDVKGYGTVGLITYMRTDSVRISKEAQEDCRNFVIDKFGKKYVEEKPRNFKSKKKNIQDAHEAIRPTYMKIEPDKAKENLKPEQYKLYKLIWNRFLASQMACSKIDVTSISIVDGKYGLKVSGSRVKFDGFMKAYEYTTEDEKSNKALPKLQEGELLIEKSTESKQHFTQPPARFSEASLVKTLEENGIGRPSTYAPILSTLLDRKYIQREKRTLIPTELGNIVNNILSEYFKQIVDVEFTAEMESKLDAVEDGKDDWRKVVDEFYKPLKKSIDVAEKEVAKITIKDEVTDIKCEKCGRNMVIKHGRFGDFLACPGYPECKNTKPIVEELDVKCPKCGGKVLVKRSRKGRKFYGCSNYPKCDFVSWYEPVNEKCPACGSYMVKKYNKTRGNYLECSNSECKYRKYDVEENKDEKIK